MKKALAILLAFSVLLSLTACGGSTAPASSSAESEQSTDAVEDAAIAESTAEDQNLNADAAEPAADDQDLNANTADPAAFADISEKAEDAGTPALLSLDRHACVPVRLLVCDDRLCGKRACEQRLSALHRQTRLYAAGRPSGDLPFQTGRGARRSPAGNAAQHLARGRRARHFVCGNMA